MVRATCYSLAIIILVIGYHQRWISTILAFSVSIATEIKIDPRTLISSEIPVSNYFKLKLKLRIRCSL